MSIRQRTTFRFSEDGDDSGPVLDEQEQEELINDLRQHSEVRNAQYVLLLQVLIAVSVILQLMYLFSGTRESPFVAILLPEATPSKPIPASTLFIAISLFLHANLSLSFLSQTHMIRRSVSSTFGGHVPLRYVFLFVASAIAPLLSSVLWQSWADLLWWSTTPCLVYFMYSAQCWFDEEAEAIRGLEKMRYDAKGA
ncbi:hypothetical protein BDY19DRAFT_994740 [Irpex rosettiformis]|uniref:Uncharacterized protein n=1 Tax=Irpex rosettiformis TaxID=378272 RepID=A0ACB8U0J5_9APHY|nr:hypothetical protein BDY19DRAFT_994740 [Irpex rosettiformis]